MENNLISWNGAWIVVGNEPIDRPGVYVFTNRGNGKRYVGISQNLRRRVMEHMRVPESCPPLLKKALKKYGLEMFVVVPVAYSVHGDTDHLPEIEAALIAEFDTIKNGYNVQAASGAVGPYGEAFAAIAKRVQNDPEMRGRLEAKMRATMSTPEFKAKRSKLSKQIYEERAPEIEVARIQKMKATRGSDEFKAKQSATAKAASEAETPERKAARIQKMKATMASPEFRAKRSQALKAFRASETAEQRSERNAKMKATMATEEFKAWRSKTSKEVHSRPDVETRRRQAIKIANNRPETKEAIAASKRGRVWINNGNELRCVYPDAIPDGWVRGRKAKS